MRSRGRAWSLALGVGAYALAVRPRLLRWGATDEEVRRPYPGADLVPGGERGSTMAVTIDAPPDRVWPWLVQMGCDRAGWYSWDRLDSGGVPSADRIHPQWQAAAVGDRWASTPDGETWFEVVRVDPLGRQYDPAGPRPPFSIDRVWCFLLEELPPGRTRLVSSGYASMCPRLLAVLTVLLLEPAVWIMQTRQFTNLKRRAET